jgi:hypothetical protein
MLGGILAGSVAGWHLQHAHANAALTYVAQVPTLEQGK